MKVIERREQNEMKGERWSIQRNGRGLDWEKKKGMV